MQKRRLGTILILLGALLLAGALGLLGYNQWDNGRAQKAAAQVLDQLETTLDEQENHLQLLVPTQVDDTAREMTVTAIDGWDYIGYLSIPSIGLALPVMSEWSYPGLKIAPGRYAGSVFTDDLVICGHNYAQHFSPVKRHHGAVCGYGRPGVGLHRLQSGDPAAHPDRRDGGQGGRR